MTTWNILKNYNRNEIKAVVCKSDGDVKYCNALSVNGTCHIRDCACELATAVIVEKNNFTQYLAVEHK